MTFLLPPASSVRHGHPHDVEQNGPTPLTSSKLHIHLPQERYRQLQLLQSSHDEVERLKTGELADMKEQLKGLEVTLDTALRNSEQVDTDLSMRQVELAQITELLKVKLSELSLIQVRITSLGWSFNPPLGES